FARTSMYETAGFVGKRISDTEPTGTPVRLTPAPTIRPPARAKWISYSTLCSQRCSCWPSEKMVAMKTTSAARTSSPTLSWDAPMSRGRQELVQHRVGRSARLVARAGEANASIVQEGDPVGNQERAGEVVGHDHGCEAEPMLDVADQLVDL